MVHLAGNYNENLNTAKTVYVFDGKNSTSGRYNGTLVSCSETFSRLYDIFQAGTGTGLMEPAYPSVSGAVTIYRNGTNSNPTNLRLYFQYISKFYSET